MYDLTLLSLGAMALLMLVQLVIADVIGISLKHVPGTPVPADHNSLLFRASRTVANANESIAIFILAVCFCVYSGAQPHYTAVAAWGFVVARFAYAIMYYCNLKILRSSVFALSLICLAALLFIGFMQWL